MRKSKIKNCGSSPVLSQKEKSDTSLISSLLSSRSRTKKRRKKENLSVKFTSFSLAYLVEEEPETEDEWMHKCYVTLPTAMKVVELLDELSNDPSFNINSLPSPFPEGEYNPLNNTKRKIECNDISELFPIRVKTVEKKLLFANTKSLVFKKKLEKFVQSEHFLEDLEGTIEQICTFYFSGFTPDMDVLDDLAYEEEKDESEVEQESLLKVPIVDPIMMSELAQSFLYTQNVINAYALLNDHKDVYRLLDEAVEENIDAYQLITEFSLIGESKKSVKLNPLNGNLHANLRAELHVSTMKSVHKCSLQFHIGRLLLHQFSLPMPVSFDFESFLPPNLPLKDVVFCANDQIKYFRGERAVLSKISLLERCSLWLPYAHHSSVSDFLLKIVLPKSTLQSRIKAFWMLQKSARNSLADVVKTTVEYSLRRDLRKVKNGFEIMNYHGVVIGASETEMETLELSKDMQKLVFVNILGTVTRNMGSLEGDYEDVTRIRVLERLLLLEERFNVVDQLREKKKVKFFELATHVLRHRNERIFSSAFRELLTLLGTKYTNNVSFLRQCKKLNLANTEGATLPNDVTAHLVDLEHLTRMSTSESLIALHSTSWVPNLFAKLKEGSTICEDNTVLFFLLLNLNSLCQVFVKKVFAEEECGIIDCTVLKYLETYHRFIFSHFMQQSDKGVEHIVNFLKNVKIYSVTHFYTQGWIDFLSLFMNIDDNKLKKHIEENKMIEKLEQKKQYQVVFSSDNSYCFQVLRKKRVQKTKEVVADGTDVLQAFEHLPFEVKLEDISTSPML